MIFADIEKPTTVLALVVGAVASVVCALITLAILLSNWVEPDCDVPTASNASYCAINAEDVSRALPAATMTLLVVLFTALLRWRVLRHQKFTRNESRSARIQTDVVLGASALAVVVLVASTVIVNLA